MTISTMTPNFKEDYISQIPALQQLVNLGYTYLSPIEALTLRDNKLGNIVLTHVLEAQIIKLNRITYKGQEHSFSANNIQEAIRRLTNEPYDGLLRTNERVYELLTLGTSLTQSIDGDTKSYSLKYIDWEHPENNVYHVTDEFEIERTRSKQTRRPDIICFVNGIPLVVIECKRPDKQSEEGAKSVQVGISQMLRNQRDKEIPHLFIFSQLLMSISRNDALFGTTATPLRFWTIWKEEDEAKYESELRRLINTPLDGVQKDRLYGERDKSYFVRKYFDELEQSGERFATTQDRFLYYLMRPDRLLELIYQFVVFDGGVKKVPRYQQYFAVKATLDRVTHLDKEGKRAGGVIWHTTGTGKSLTMVMLSKALTLHPDIANPKVVLVTDRIDLDIQLFNTFKACGKTVVKAESGTDLVKLVTSSKADIITTVIDKFDTAARLKAFNDSADIFVLVDESHRSQYGVTHAQMRRVFKNACYIGFTGTPLLKKEKSTAAKFGSFIHTYPIRKAVDDKVVVPLIYEGRMAELDPNQTSLDKWFERVTKNLSEEQKRDLKRKFSRQDELSKAEQRIQQIAFDISEHYTTNFQGTGLKAQLAVPTKKIALKYKEFLDEFGDVTSAVVISPPDTREGNETVDQASEPKIQAFWKKMMERYGTEEAYNREIKASFALEEGVEILIVVDKLLTGFDEPRNTILYTDKPLKDHGLLQAISRVNRLFEGKQFGYIIDYRGVLGALNETLQVYDSLAGFDEQDVAGTIQDVAEIIKQLPQLHSTLWRIFQTVGNRQDVEQMEQFLAPEDTRHEFYRELRAFANALQVALSTVAFYDQVPEETIRRYKEDLAFFHNLRNSVKQRYAETVEYSTYEKKIRKLIDKHIASAEITQVTEQVNIFDVEAFEAEVERVEGTAAQADTIAYRMKRTISENLEQDPAFYKKFSSLIDETIQEYRQGRLEEAEYYQRIHGHYEKFTQGHDDQLPENIKHHKHAPAYFGIIEEYLEPHKDGLDVPQIGANVAIKVEEIIESLKIRDWTHSLDVQNRMKNQIEDFLLELNESCELHLGWDEIDAILDQLIHTAKQRNNL